MKKALLALFTLGAFQASAQTPVLIDDIYPGASGSNPFLLTEYNNKLYFVASESVNGRELRVYNGVNNPTLVYNIYSGVSSAFLPSADMKMAILNGKMYFSATNGTTGREFMMYDGTNNPSLVYDINPGSGDSDPYNMRTVGNKIFMSGTDGSSGFELFVYDGVNAPVMFDLNAGSGSGSPSDFVSYNNKVYFRGSNATAGTELFVYDPGTNSATLAYDVDPGPTSSGPNGLIVHNNKIYFIGLSAAYGTELYSYDGSTATRLTDLNTGSSNSITGKLAVYNNQIYFNGNDGVGGYQLYKYDPSTNVAGLVYNIYPGNNAFISRFAVYGNKLYFNAPTAAYGNELWVHDGSGTSMVADLNTGIDDSDPSNFVVFNSRLYFAAETAALGAELYSLTDPLNVQSTKFDGAVTITPNPTTGAATLQLSLNAAATLNVQVTDVTGKVIWNIGSKDYPAHTSALTIPLSGNAAGLYYYRLCDSKGVLMSSGKIVKQ